MMWQNNEDKDQKKLEPVNSDSGHYLFLSVLRWSIKPLLAQLEEDVSWWSDPILKIKYVLKFRYDSFILYLQFWNQSWNFYVKIDLYINLNLHYCLLQNFHLGSTSLIKSLCTDSNLIYIRKQFKNSSKSDPIQVNLFI